jgi:hypothetical protein
MKTSTHSDKRHFVASPVNDLRAMARHALIAIGLTTYTVHFDSNAPAPTKTMRLADSLLDEATRRGFGNTIELREMLTSGRISARALELIDSALQTIPDGALAGVINDAFGVDH